MKYLSDDPFEKDIQASNELDTQAEELIFLAYTGLDYLEERNQVVPRAKFFLDISKTLLDTLRSNSKLLEFYNETAERIFNYCKKFKNKREFKKISDTLHSHLGQILKLEEQPEQTSKIPYPIKLDDYEQVTHVLKLRSDQLALAISMDEWADAYRICTSIHTLRDKVTKMKNEGQLKEMQAEFFKHLSSIFWESNLQLFHAYALQNLQYLIKSSDVPPAEKSKIYDQFVLAALSIPFTDKLNNFNRLSFTYFPNSMKNHQEDNYSVRDKLQKIT